MRITGEMILSDFGTKLPLDRRRKDALAEYARRASWAADARSAQRWVEKAWDLKAYEAKDLLQGNASEAIYERILKHPNGGFDVGLAVMTAVIGHSIEEWAQRKFAAQRERLEREARQLEQQQAEALALAAQARAIIGLSGRVPAEPAVWEGRTELEPTGSLGREQDRDALAASETTPP